MITYSAENVLEILLSSEKINPNDLPASHGLYCLWDHLERPIYIGETHSKSQGYRSRIGKHIAGSVDMKHMFSRWYNLGPLFTFHEIKDPIKLKRKPDYKIRIKQEKKNASLVKKIKNKMIRDLCTVTIYPIYRGELSEADYHKMLLNIETNVVDIARKKYLSENVIPFKNEIIERYANDCTRTIEAFFAQDCLFKEYLSEVTT
ncbi:hypothetical protein [uncultured Psychromonas sp.]|uniref:hypothetical protein n=1 Tax=uncultured Psychromonas sp. TaxID=173974 RepID=UPI0026073E5B|nr:hypothetical protein [uncultured Psychromonas sp.]